MCNEEKGPVFSLIALDTIFLVKSQHSFQIQKILERLAIIIIK